MPFIDLILSTLFLMSAQRARALACAAHVPALQTPTARTRRVYGHSAFRSCKEGRCFVTHWGSASPRCPREQQQLLCRRADTSCGINARVSPVVRANTLESTHGLASWLFQFSLLRFAPSIAPWRNFQQIIPSLPPSERMHELKLQV